MKSEHAGRYLHPGVFVEEPAYLKDPFRSDLGLKILEEGLLLMTELGYEQFTFKKLAAQINSTEASIYRYFESKHKLLLYYFLYYWHDIEGRMAFATANIPHAEKRLNAALKVMVGTGETAANSPLPARLLKKLITDEYVKVYLHKMVDEENQKGLFRVYKRVCRTLAEIVQEINPRYPWHTPLVSTVMQSIYSQHFYAEHLPGLTHAWKNDEEMLTFFVHLVLKNIKPHAHETH